MAVYLVRHGQSTGNLHSFFVCREDHPLTNLGVQQAEQLGAWLKQQGVYFDAVYASTLQRASRTAGLISEVLGGPAPVLDARLMEYDCGELEGLSQEEVARRFPRLLTKSIEEWADLKEYGGESYQEVAQRTESFRLDLERRYHAGGEVLVVAHGGSIMHLLAQWCSAPLTRWLMFNVAHCSCIRLDLKALVGRTYGEVRWFIHPELFNTHPHEPQRL